jgi:hypothetical protein
VNSSQLLLLALIHHAALPLFSDQLTALTPGRRVRLPLSLMRAPEILSPMVGLRLWWTTFLRPKKPRRVVVVVVWGWERDCILSVDLD